VRARSSGRVSGPAIARGFALPAALLTLVVIAALAAGAFFAALQETRMGRNERLAEAAFDAAEAGLSVVLARGRAGAWSALEAGDSVTVAERLPGGSGGFEATVLRLNGRLFLLRSAGSDAGGRTSRTLAMLARASAVGERFTAALSVAGGVGIGTGASVEGRDTDPPGWTGCDTAGRDTVAGLALPQGTTLLVPASCAGESCIGGAPPVRRDSLLRVAGVLTDGDSAWVRLAALADKVVGVAGAGARLTPGPVGTALACEAAVAANWGEPGRPPQVPGCQGYRPVILARGDLILEGGRGQGVLLVEGDLTLTGPAEFYGVVLVRGRLRATAEGARILGWVGVEGGAGGAEAALLEGTAIAFSRCAVGPAWARIAPVRRLPERGWAYLY
jgi:hypothetical protein